MTELEYKQYLSDINNRRKGGAKSSTPFSSEDGSQMGPSPTPVPPKVSATDVGQDESSFTQKAGEALNTVGSFGLGVGSGIGSGVANLAGYGADVASGLGQDVKGIFTGEGLGTQGAQALLGESQSEAGNAIRGLGSKVFDNEYGKMGTDSGAFGAGQTTGETGVALLGANKLGLLKNPELGGMSLKTVKGLGELGLKGIATTDVTTQATEGRGATALERLVGGGVGVAVPTIVGGAKLGYQLLPKKEITVLGNKITTGGGKTFKEYMSEKAPIKSTQEAAESILTAIPSLPKEVISNIEDLAPLISKTWKNMKKGGSYAADGVELSPREAFAVAVDKNRAAINDAAASMRKASPVSTTVSALDDSIRPQLERGVAFDSSLKTAISELDNLKTQIGNGKINLNDINRIQTTFKGISEGLDNPESKNILWGINTQFNQMIDDALKAGGRYVKLKSDAGKLEALFQGLPEGVRKSFTIDKGTGMNFTSELGQASYSIGRGLSGGFNTAAASSFGVVSRVLSKLGLAASKDPEMMFEKAFKYLGDNAMSQLSGAERARLSELVVKARSASTRAEQNRLVKQLEEESRKAAAKAELDAIEAAKIANREKGLKIADDFLNNKMQKEAEEQSAKRIAAYNKKIADEKAAELNKKKGLQIADDFLNNKMQGEVDSQTLARINSNIAELLTPSFIAKIKKGGEAAKQARLTIARKAITELGKKK